MSEKPNIVWCERCGAVIEEDGYILERKVYCCKACAEGHDCDCRERAYVEDERRVAHGAPTYTTYGE